MKTLPQGLQAYKRTQLFTNDSIPKKLLSQHYVAEGFWAMICVTEGCLEYVIDSSEKHTLTPGKQGIVEPGVAHHVNPLGPVTFYIEFYKAQ